MHVYQADLAKVLHAMGRKDAFTTDYMKLKGTIVNNTGLYHHRISNGDLILWLSNDGDRNFVTRLAAQNSVALADVPREGLISNVIERTCGDSHPLPPPAAVGTAGTPGQTGNEASYYCAVCQGFIPESKTARVS